MGWLRDRLGRFRDGPKEVAERLTGSLFHLEQEQAALTDREAVQRWLREMRPEHETQVFVHRPWGTVAPASGTSRRRFRGASSCTGRPDADPRADTARSAAWPRSDPESVEGGPEDRLDVGGVGLDCRDGVHHVEDLFDRQVRSDLAAALGGVEQGCTGGDHSRAIVTE